MPVALKMLGTITPGFAIAHTGLISPFSVRSKQLAARAPVAAMSVWGE